MGTGSLERQTLALLWRDALNEGWGGIMEGSGAEGAGFEKTNRAMYWLDPPTGWSQEAFLFILVLGHRWGNRGPGRGEKAGALGASGGSRAGVCLSLQELTQGWEGRAWLLGWGLGEGLLPSPGAAWPGLGVGSRETLHAL